jgi:chemotaxis protein histidine kinase CheA
VRRSAHTLKGAFLMFGAQEAAHSAQALEAAAKDERLPDETVISRLTELTRLVLEDLQGHRLFHIAQESEQS